MHALRRPPARHRHRLSVRQLSTCSQALLKVGLKQLAMEKCASLFQIRHDVAAHTLRNGCKPKLYVCTATIRDRQISSVDHLCRFPVDQFVHRH